MTNEKHCEQKQAKTAKRFFAQFVEQWSEIGMNENRSVQYLTIVEPYYLYSLILRMYYYVMIIFGVYFYNWRSD